MNFASLGLTQPICAVLEQQGYETPTDIQAAAIPAVLAGKDVIGCAQTGTGKTAAFALPIIQKLMEADENKPRQSAENNGQNREHQKNTRGKNNANSSRPIRALILSPTRELAIQIGENFKIYAGKTRLRHAQIFGGVKQGQQTRALQQGVDVLVATPGRLLDLMGQGFIRLDDIDIFVLDEADRMLDMGFIHDLRKIEKHIPQERQTLLFSATMPEPIRKLAASIMSEPVHIEVAPESTAAEAIDQAIYHVEKEDKVSLLTHIFDTTRISRVLVFTRTKYGADKLVKQLGRNGFEAAAIHGDKTQANRQRALARFRSGQMPVLIATDVAARGIDVDDISHVINYELPNEAETYIHRIGRTARAGASGIAMAFCSPEERGKLRSVERLLKQRLRIADHQFAIDPGRPASDSGQENGRSGGRGGKGRNRRGSGGGKQAGQHNQSDRPAKKTHPMNESSGNGNRRPRRRRRSNAAKA